ncbi:MAG: hypothetical protein ABI724_03540 [Betaproteobacteria bacterium]
MLTGLVGWGERLQVIFYKQGHYEGKPDQPPCAGAPWNGNKAQWEAAIRTRNQNRNEYHLKGQGSTRDEP